MLGYRKRGAGMGKSAIEFAQYLVEGMEERHQARLEQGDVGDWQTEINEVRRILGYIIEAIRNDRSNGPS
jgi:hypothetical protein